MSVIGALPVRQGFFLAGQGSKVSACQAFLRDRALIWKKMAWRNLMVYGAYLAL